MSSFFDPVIGSCLGAIDRAYYLTRAIVSGRPLFFSHGWGSPETLAACQAEFDQLFARCKAAQRPVAAPPLPIDGHDSRVSWSAYHDAASADVERGDNINGNSVSCSRERRPCGACCHDRCRCRSAERNQSAAPSSSQSHCCQSRRRLLEPTMVCHEGVFDSPSASLLPDEAKQVRFLTAAPPRVRGPWCGERNHDSEADIFPASIIFLMPSTGEQEYGARLQLARTLVARHGAVCVLPTVPFYGARRPLGQREHYIGTVAEFALQSLITSCEAALLIEWAHILFPRAALCVSGFSWGGAMASTAGLLASRLIGGGGSERLTRRTDQSGRLVINGGSGDDAAFAARAPALSRSPARRPGRGGRSKSRGREPLARVSSPSPPPPRIAIVSYAGSASPAILVDGLLAGDVDWTALGATAAQHGMDASRESMRTHLFERLSALNLDNFVAEWERRRSSGNGSNQRQRGSRTDASDMYESQVRDSLATSAIRAILCISMSHDHFVRKEWGQILFRTLTAAAPPGTHARFEVRSGGHAYAFLKRSTHQVGAINDALELMLQRED